MASLKKRGDIYYIRFFAVMDGKRKRKELSLGTPLKREAEKLRIKYEDLYARGEIDPFSGWTPKKEKTERKVHDLNGGFRSFCQKQKSGKQTDEE